MEQQEIFKMGDRDKILIKTCHICSEIFSLSKKGKKRKYKITIKPVRKMYLLRFAFYTLYLQIFSRFKGFFVIYILIFIIKFSFLSSQEILK